VRRQQNCRLQTAHTNTSGRRVLGCSDELRSGSRTELSFLQFVDAFWMEYVMGMEKRNCWISQVLRLIPCEMCKWAPEDSARVPRWNCHFLPFSDAFWMEYVMGMEKRNCQFCGTFCVKCGSGQGNIPVRFHDGAVIFSKSLIQSDGICGGNGEAELVVLTDVWRIPCEICKCEAEYTAPVPLRKCHLLQFTDAFWTEFVNGNGKTELSDSHSLAAHSMRKMQVTSGI
jgi:hypothetical protein